MINLLNLLCYSVDRPISNFSSSIPDDGFAVTAAEPWVKQKIEIIRQYLSAFVTAVASQVDELVFVDLFAQNGLCCLGNSKDIFAGIPLMALQQELPITKFVFCESDPEQFRILKIRVNKYFRERNSILLNGRPEDIIDKIKMYIPESRRGHKVAVFCVGDSFGLEPNFDVIQSLKDSNFTFLIPVTFHLGNRINYSFYLRKEREKLRKFIWLDKEIDTLRKEIDNNAIFYKRLIQIYEHHAQQLGMNTSVSTQKIDSGLMEIPTYSICLLSKKYSAKAIQLDALAGSNIQFALFNQN